MAAAIAAAEVVVDDVLFATQPFALRLPDEIVLEVLTYWDVRTLVVNQRVCRTWRESVALGVGCALKLLTPNEPTNRQGPFKPIKNFVVLQSSTSVIMTIPTILQTIL
jgi:hypothetical protein